MDKNKNLIFSTTTQDGNIKYYIEFPMYYLYNNELIVTMPTADILIEIKGRLK